LAIEDEIRAKFGDVDSTIVGNERFFAALGRIAFLWAGIESSLDLSMSLIHQKLGGNELEPILPFSLSNKIKFLRKAFKTIPALAKGRAAWLQVLTNVKRQSGSRNRLIHSFAISEIEGGYVKMATIIRGGEILKGSEFYTSDATLEKIVAQTVVTANTCLWLTSLLLDEHQISE
jgi:hypothetical protein